MKILYVRLWRVLWPSEAKATLVDCLTTDLAIGTVGMEKLVQDYVAKP